MSRTSPDTAAQLPDEHRIAFPEAWTAYTLDRRGRGAPRPVDVDPEAPATLQALFAEFADTMELPLELFENTEHTAAIRAGLAGAADPFGAGMALALLASARREAPALLDGLGRDAWITRHGIAFAACATIESLGHHLYWYRGTRLKASTQIRPVQLLEIVRSPRYVDRLSPLRSLLAALPDHEHAEVVAALESHRDTDAKRFLSAILMPDQEAWVIEACRLHNGHYYFSHGNDSLWAVASKREHLELSSIRAMNQNQCDSEQIARLIDALGAEALPVLVGTLEHEHRPSAEARGLLFDAISRLPSDAAPGHLLRNLADPAAMTALRAAVERFPVRVLRSIAAIAPTSTGSVKARLAGITRSIPLLGEATATLDEGDRAAVESLLRSTERHPVAATIPEAFATPPWSGFANRRTKPVTGPVPPPIDELRWAEGERQEWEMSSESGSYWVSPYAWERRSIEDIERYQLPEFLAYGPEARARTMLDRWDGSARGSDVRTIRMILNRYGEAAAARVLELIKKKSSYRSVLLPFVNLEAARIAAAWLARSRSDRTAGKAWLDRHASEAAALLIPDAIGKAAKPRRVAAGALRHLAESDRASVEARAAEYGEAAAEAVAALLDADPLDPGKPVPKLASWAEASMLPQVLLRGGEAALPPEAVETLLRALSLDEPERLYAGVDVLTAQCDPASLAVFSWGLFELWLSYGAPPKDVWAMYQLRRFADEDAVRRLTALVHEWPGRSQSRRAVQGLEILGGIGSEAALRAVHTISRKAKYKALKKTAADQIETIAERLRLDTEQLADRLVPDFGLEAASALVLDYGPRTFTVGFDERLRPFVVEGAGKRRAAPPKPAGKDDPELATVAYERFTTLRRELKATATEQVKRLEAAMMAGRTWEVAEFGEYLVDHPLMRHLTGRLVWQAEIAGTRRSFRIAEDRTFADIDEEELTLPEGAVVRIAHPVILGEELGQWAETLADYEILQPFEQLTRPVVTLTEEERKTGRLRRLEGALVGSGPVRGLLRRGWRVDDVRRDGETRYGYSFELPGGGHVRFEPDPMLHPAYDSGTEHKLERVEFRLPENVDPVVLCEALAAVAKLARAV